MKARLLIVDDEPAMCELLDEGLTRRGYTVTTAASGSAALGMLGEQDVDVVISDLRMAGMSGLELCAEVRRLWPDLPVVLLTAFGDLDAAVDAMRAGAYDFFAKPVEIDALDLAITRAARHHELTQVVRRLRREVREKGGLPGIIGNSPPMRKLADLVARTAAADSPVLITGETGTGKELVARALHDASPRSQAPFVAVNCAAIPADLLESELFGHVRGAFTDARSARRGLFVEAGDGTLFLDELGELPLPLQPKLLRALQEARIRPVGSDREIAVRCRVIAASNQDLALAAEQGEFRIDLFYRVAVIRLAMPPLRVRASDILLLAQHFIERENRRTGHRITGLTTPVAQALLAYPWPGNVRELENCIERAVAFTSHDRLLVDDLPDEIRDWRGPAPEHEEPNSAGLLPLALVEQRHIERVLAATSGNKLLAARILGLDRRTLYRKLDRYKEPDPT